MFLCVGMGHTGEGCGSGGGGGGLPWQPDLGQHVTLFFWASVLPYANEACANLQTLALVSLCILSAFGHERETERERIE